MPIDATVADTLNYIINQAGFYAARPKLNDLPHATQWPPRVSSARENAGPFGVKAHEHIQPAIEDAKSLSLPHANRFVEGVHVDSSTGEVLRIKVKPGGAGTAGTLFFDVVFLKEGQTLAEGDLLQSKAEFVADAKFSGKKKNPAQAVFAARHNLPNVLLEAGDFALQERMATQVNKLAKARGMSLQRQGGFASIDGLGVIAIATTAGIILTSEDRLDALVDLAKSAPGDIALGALFGKLAGSATLGGVLTMVVGLQSDSPAHDEFVAKQKMIERFIFDHYPGVLNQYRYSIAFGLLKSDWVFEVVDAKRYGEISSKIWSLVDDQYVFGDGDDPDAKAHDEGAASGTPEFGADDEASETCERGADDEASETCERGADDEASETCERGADDEASETCERGADDEASETCERGADDEASETCERGADDEASETCERGADDEASGDTSRQAPSGILTMMRQHWETLARHAPSASSSCNFAELDHVARIEFHVDDSEWQEGSTSVEFHADDDDGADDGGADAVDFHANDDEDAWLEVPASEWVCNRIEDDSAATGDCDARDVDDEDDEDCADDADVEDEDAEESEELGDVEDFDGGWTAADASDDCSACYDG